MQLSFIKCVHLSEISASPTPSLAVPGPSCGSGDWLQSLLFCSGAGTVWFYWLPRPPSWVNPSRPSCPLPSRTPRTRWGSCTSTALGSRALPTPCSQTLARSKGSPRWVPSHALHSHVALDSVSSFLGSFACRFQEIQKSLSLFWKPTLKIAFHPVISPPGFSALGLHGRRLSYDWRVQSSRPFPPLFPWHV